MSDETGIEPRKAAADLSNYATKMYVDGAVANAKTGGIVTLTLLEAGANWAVNDYAGVRPGASSSAPFDQTPWVAPCAGVLKRMRVRGRFQNDAATTVTVVKAPDAASLVYASTALTLTVASGAMSGVDSTHSVAVNEGDCVLTRLSGTQWNAGWAHVTAQFIPNTP